MGTKVTYQHVMTGVWGRERPSSCRSDVGCSPRKGGAPIRLVKPDRKAAFAKMKAAEINQQKG